MFEKEITILKEGGLRGRNAAMFVQIASGFNSQVLIECGNKKVNAKSMMGVLSLMLEKDDEITLIVVGDDADIAAAKLEGFLIV